MRTVPIFVFLLLFISCQKGVNKEVIENIRFENSSFEKDINLKTPGLHSFYSRTEKAYQNLINQIPGKRKREFNSDKQIQELLSLNEENLQNAYKNLSVFQDSLKIALIANQLFIESLSASKYSNKEAIDQWSSRKERTLRMQLAMQEINSEINKLEKNSRSIYQDILDKYTQNAN